MPLGPRHQTVLLIGLLLFCWLAMMLVHELGHMIGAWLTGGHVVQLVWYPLVFSRTDLFPLNAPLFVVWSGPVIGILLPVMLDAFACWRRWPMAGCLTFFAGFCLIANGLYISIGSLDRIADAGRSVAMASRQLLLWFWQINHGITNDCPTGMDHVRPRPCIAAHWFCMWQSRVNDTRRIHLNAAKKVAASLRDAGALQELTF